MREHHKTRKSARVRAWRADRATAGAGAGQYGRSRLSRLIPVGPDEVAGGSAATGNIVLKLARALRDERRRGKAGHWTYDLDRHIGLTEAWRAERDRFARESGETLPT